jgi:hypothetical protein
MTAPRNATTHIPRVPRVAGDTTPTTATPSATTGGTTPLLGIGGTGNIVITRRVARQLAARARVHGLDVPADIAAKAATIPAEDPEGDTRPAGSPADDAASVDATREQLDRAEHDIEHADDTPPEQATGQATDEPHDTAGLITPTRTRSREHDTTRSAKKPTRRTR